jgi:hypothetical protein
VHCPDPDLSWLQYDVTGGTPYLIRVSSVSGGAGGDVVLNIALAPPIAIVTDADSVTVPEGETESFQVRLDGAPAADVTVTVSRSSGDSDITVQSGSSLTFSPTDWDEWQPVTLAAAQDGDSVNGTATIHCSGDDLIPKDVTATEDDDDVVPPNDLCADATPVGEGTYYADTRNADGDGGVSAPCGTFNDGHSVWWLYTPSASGVATIDTCGSSFPTNLKLQENNCVSGAQLHCSRNDDVHCPDPDLSWLQYDVTGGTPYLIRVSSVSGGAGGDVVLNIALSPVGDLDHDGDVDLDDFELFATCMAGPDVLDPPPGCDPSTFGHADLNGDGDVDLHDFAEFQILCEP